jgi:hypothetical protein
MICISESYGEKKIVFNCNNLAVNELKSEIGKIKKGFLVLKNIHLASEDLLLFILKQCMTMNSELFYFFDCKF